MEAELNSAESTRPRVLITGTTRGLGAAVAQQLQAQGFEVVEVNRERMDLSDRTSVRQAAGELLLEPVFDLAILNAGVGDFHSGPASCSNCETIIQINFLCNALFMDLMQARVRHFLIVSSVSAGMCTAPADRFHSMCSRNRLHSYGTSKKYLCAWANELRRRSGARVSAVWPGVIATGIWEGPMDFRHFHVRKIFKWLYYKTHRISSPEDAAAGVTDLVEKGLEDGRLYDLDRPGTSGLALPPEEPGLWDCVVRELQRCPDDPVREFCSFSEDHAVDVAAAVGLVLLAGTIAGIVVYMTQKKKVQNKQTRTNERHT